MRRRNKALLIIVMVGLLFGLAYGVTIQYPVEPTTAANWTNYDGNTDDANSTALLTGVTTSADPNTTVITTRAANTLELFVGLTTDANTATLNVVEYSAATPTLATEVRCTEVGTGSDQPRTVDSSAFGQTTGSEYYIKDPLRVPITPGSFIKLTLSDSPTASVFIKYRLTNLAVNAD